MNVNYNAGNDNKYFTDQQREAMFGRDGQQVTENNQITESGGKKPDKVEYLTE